MDAELASFCDSVFCVYEIINCRQLNNSVTLVTGMCMCVLLAYLENVCVCVCVVVVYVCGVFVGVATCGDITTLLTASLPPSPPPPPPPH